MDKKTGAAIKECRSTQPKPTQLDKMKKLVLFLIAHIFTAQVSAQHLFTVKQLEKIASYKSDKGPYSVKSFVNQYGFYKNGELSSDYNKFIDKHGNVLETIQSKSKKTGKVTFTVIFRIKNPSSSVMNSYNDYLNKNYSKSASLYLQNGRYQISTDYKADKGLFDVTVYNNTGLTFTTYAKKIADRKFEITPFTTAILVKFAKGSKLTLTANGSMTLGSFVGNSGPNGINGYQLYNYVSNLPHGSLMGKLGENGNWFLIGAKKTITVNETAILHVRINNRDLANNYGSYFLEYNIVNTNTNSATSSETYSSQCLSGNCTNGYGKKKYSNGTYEGQFKNSFRNGRGVYKWNNGESYEGDWIQGKKEGQGKLVLINGNKYIGDFKNNNRQGKGIEYDKNGNLLYDGEWKNDKKATQQKSSTSNINIGCTTGNCKNGYGKYRYNNGFYHGFFKNGKRNGHGHFSWNNGDFYFGNWTNDVRNDYGSYFWKNGTNYVGEWKNNGRTGYGTKKNLDKTYSRGLWQSGELLKSYSLVDNGSTKGCTKGNCKNGLGKYVYNNGEYYLGFFINGKRYAGTYYYTNGDLYQGQFGTDGSFTGYGYYLWKNNSYYRGQFKNFKRTGIGFYVNKVDNSEMKGVWTNGKLTTSY